MTRRGARAAALVGAALAGALLVVVVHPAASTPAPPPTPTVGTATVVRSDLVSTVNASGTLGDAPSDPVVNRLAGTYTWLPSPGTVVAAGQTLFRVDNVPVVLMTGTTPAWRPFVPGMTAGPDVAELQANLISLGAARGLFDVPSGRFDALTADALERWQTAEGETADAVLDLGRVVFLDGPVLAGAPTVAPGDAATPGDVPYGVTTTARAVTVPLGPSLPEVQVGEAVSITLPSGDTTPGTVSAVGPAPPTGSPATGSSTSSAVATVTPARPAATGTATGQPVEVSLTAQAVRGVLAVPITALLAVAGGGYGVEVVGRSGPHHLVGVTTGMFTATQVQVSGRGIVPGVRVVVAQ